MKQRHHGSPAIRLLEIYRHLAWRVVDENSRNRRLTGWSIFLTVLTSSSLAGATRGLPSVEWAGLFISFLLLFLLVYQLTIGPQAELEKVRRLQKQAGDELSYLDNATSPDDKRVRLKIKELESEMNMLRWKGKDPNKMTPQERQEYEQSHLQ